MQIKTFNNEYYEKEMKKIFLYKEREQFSKGLILLHSLEKKFKKDRIVNGLLATFYFAMANYDKSAKYFKITSLLNPKSELSSLGLFHCLIHQGKTIAALNEIIRFTSDQKFNSYKITISELKKNKNNFNRKQILLINKLP